MDRNLMSFLQKAKKKTYASKVHIAKKTKDGGKEYIYKEGDYLYKDKYFGFENFRGKEIILIIKNLVWSMTYEGKILSSSPPKKCYNFLKTCLKKVPEDFPVRGPKKFNKGDFKYKNKWKGNIDNFSGEEKVFWKGKQIYSLNYFGGKIR